MAAPTTTRTCTSPSPSRHPTWRCHPRRKSSRRPREAARADPTVRPAALAELELIAAIEAALEDRSGRLLRWMGDDAAVVRAAPLAVTSIDTVVEGTHFRLSTHSAADVGWKALAGALSDLAAMGARSGEAYVSLVLPRGFDGALELVEAMEELAAGCKTTIAGGDVVSGPALTVTVAVTGWADERERARRPRRRAPGRPGRGDGRPGRIGGRAAAARAR